MARLHVKVKNHIEIMEFAITELGRTSVFISHEWLKKHNPSIDWVSNEIKFNQCPIKCTLLMGKTNPEDEEIDCEDFEDGD